MSDRDVERELAETLERTTRSLPEHVLQQSVTAALRSDQVPAQGPHGRATWLRRGTALAAAVVLVLAVVSAPSVFGWLRNLDLRLPVGSVASTTPSAGSPSPSAAMQWDAMLQFREPRVRLLPGLDRAHGRQLARRHFDRQVELPDMTRVDNFTICCAVCVDIAGSNEKPRDLVDWALRR